MKALTGLARIEAAIKAERLQEETRRRRVPVTLTAPDGSKLKGIELTRAVIKAELLAAGLLDAPNDPKGGR